VRKIQEVADEELLELRRDFAAFRTRMLAVYLGTNWLWVTFVLTFELTAVFAALMAGGLALVITIRVLATVLYMIGQLADRVIDIAAPVFCCVFCCRACGRWCGRRFCFCCARCAGPADTDPYLVRLRLKVAEEDRALQEEEDKAKRLGAQSEEDDAAGASAGKDGLKSADVEAGKAPPLPPKGKRKRRSVFTARNADDRAGRDNRRGQAAGAGGADGLDADEMDLLDDIFNAGPDAAGGSAAVYPDRGDYMQTLRPTTADSRFDDDLDALLADMNQPATGMGIGMGMGMGGGGMQPMYYADPNTGMLVSYPSYGALSAAGTEQTSYSGGAMYPDPSWGQQQYHGGLMVPPGLSGVDPSYLPPTIEEDRESAQGGTPARPQRAPQAWGSPGAGDNGSVDDLLADISRPAEIT
jgi:hypothetical protein